MRLVIICKGGSRPVCPTSSPWIAASGRPRLGQQAVSTQAISSVTIVSSSQTTGGNQVGQGRVVRGG